MRKASREMDAAFALEVLDKAPYVTVSMIKSDGSPYGLPLSLVRTDEKTFYFHCALEGDKLDCIRHCPTVLLRFQGSRRFKAHSVFRGPHGASGHQGREANRSGSDGQLYPLPHTAEHGVCEDRPHGLYAAVGYRRQGVLGLSS